jgi:hypothetical protein
LLSIGVLTVEGLKFCLGNDTHWRRIVPIWDMRKR